jgi:hypothetical protein
MDSVTKHVYGFHCEAASNVVDMYIGHPFLSKPEVLRDDGSLWLSTGRR